MSIKTFSRGSFIAGAAASLAACGGAGGSGALTPLLGGSASRNLAKRISPAAKTTALGHKGFQLSSNAASSAFALHDSSGNYAASFAAGPRFIRSTYSDGSQLVLETNMPVTAQWYQLTNGIRFRFKKIKKTGSLGLLALDKAGNRTMIHIEKGMLHFSAPKGKGVKTKLPNGHAARSRAEALDAFHSVMDNKGTWTGDDDFRGASGDYPAGTGWSIVPIKNGKKSAGSKRVTQYIADSYSSYSGGGGGGSYSGGGGWSGSWSNPSYSSPSTSSSVSTSFSFSYSGNDVVVSDKPDKAHTLACVGNTILLVAALAGAVAAGTIGIVAGCGVAGAFTLGAGCVGAILLSGVANTALVGTAVLFADACL